MKVFLSYRREDSAPWAGRLNDSLTSRLGRGNIFQDVVAIHPGERFVDVMDTAVTQSDAVLAVIGPEWLSPRLSDPGDYVRHELVAALARDKLVIPVLVGAARLPAADALPDDLRPLVTRQAVALQDGDWHADIERLFAVLDAGRAARGSGRRRLLGAAVAVVLVAAAVLGWQLLTDRTTPAALSPGATTGTPGPGSASSGFVPCPIPGGEGWTSVGSGTAEPTEGDWQLTVTGGGYQASSRLVVLTLRGQVAKGPSSENFDPDTMELVAGGRRFPETCFDLAGPQRVDPGGSTEAHVGFTVDDGPDRPLTLLILLTQVNYRVDVA